MSPSPAQQRNAVSEGVALGLLMCDRDEIPYDKFRVDLAFAHAWRNWPHRHRFPQVDTDLRKGLGGALVMTRAQERKRTFVLYWARERSLVICQRAGDWDPDDVDDVQFALSVIDQETPLEGWMALARDFLGDLER